MKRIKFLFAALALLSGVMACTKTEETTPQSLLPQVTLTIVPDYTDGTVKNYNPKNNLIYLSVEVTPAKYAEALSDTSKFIHKAVFSPVQTKGGFGEAFTITPKDISYNAGAPIPFLDLCFEIDAMSAFRLDNGTYAVSCTIEDKEGVNGVSTAFVPISYENGSGGGGQEHDSNTELNPSLNVKDWADGNVKGTTVTIDSHTVNFICPEVLKYDLRTESVSTAIPGETTNAGIVSSVIFKYDASDDRFVFLSTASAVDSCSFTFDEQNNTITVTDIIGDVVVNLGCGTYIAYTAAAKVEPNNKSAFGFPYDETRSTFSTDSKSGVIAIDGIVTSIGQNAFKSDIKLTSVTIPEGVAVIGEYAFTSCKNLTSISFPSGLETIEKNAFDACNRLTEINFERCTKLTIGNTAFFGVGSDAECSPFSLELPEGLVEIGYSAFASAKISSVTLPSTLEKIGDTGFYRCGSLKTITSNAENPPILGKCVFYDFDMSTYNEVPLKSIEDIFVPDTSVDTYKAADGWSEFSDKIKRLPFL